MNSSKLCGGVPVGGSRESPSFITESIKCCNILSNIVIKSLIKNSDSFHSLKYSKFTLDKQHTAVLSSLVGNVISEQRLLWRT